MTIYYTGNGDKGKSGLIGGALLDKDDTLFDLIGNIDELNSYIAVCLLHVEDKQIIEDLDLIQDNLFSISAVVANSQNSHEISKVKVPTPELIEKEIARMGADLPELKKFVIPAGCAASSHLHVARAIARRTERNLVRFAKAHGSDLGLSPYMNRLSSFLFVSALYINHTAKVEERNPRYI
ncbi:MAG: cob(I)yrinic acid a,c-diamide adenosyltransferase [Candidatus Micrarchaeaceae archaeon]|jgi:cob(I)alamin adenosyltransferase